MHASIRRALVVAAFTAAASPAAHALTVVPDPAIPGQYSATFEGGHAFGTFADVFDFVSPVDGTLTFTFQAQLLPIQLSPGAAPFVGVLFYAYQLSGRPPVTFEDPFNQRLTGGVGPLPITQGPQVLTLGVSVVPSPIPDLQISTNYSGTIVINASPIPEPETWLLMASGLLAGFGYRGRRTTTQEHATRQVH